MAQVVSSRALDHPAACHGGFSWFLSRRSRGRGIRRAQREDIGSAPNWMLARAVVIEFEGTTPRSWLQQHQQQVQLALHTSSHRLALVPAPPIGAMAAIQNGLHVHSHLSLLLPRCSRPLGKGRPVDKLRNQFRSPLQRASVNVQNLHRIIGSYPPPSSFSSSSSSSSSTDSPSSSSSSSSSSTDSPSSLLYSITSQSSVESDLSDCHTTDLPTLDISQSELTSSQQNRIESSVESSTEPSANTLAFRESTPPSIIKVAENGLSSSSSSSSSPSSSTPPSSSTTVTTRRSKRWRSRLFTKHDFARLHATSSLLFLASFFVIEGLNLVSVWTTGNLWSPPGWDMLKPLLLIFTVSQITGMNLAHRMHPRGPNRRTFMLTAVNGLTTVLASLAATAAYPDLLRKPFIAPIVCGVVLAANGLSVWQVLAEKDDLMKSRRLRRSQGSSPAVQAAYIIPMIAPSPLMIIACKSLFLGSAEWATLYNSVHPEFYVFVFHTAMFAIFSGAFGAFVVTLRDRSLIGWLLEVFLITIPVYSFFSFELWCYQYKFQEWLPGYLLSMMDLLGPMPSP